MVDDDLIRMDMHLREANYELEAVMQKIRLATNAASDVYTSAGGVAVDEGTARMFSRWFEELEAAKDLASRSQDHVTEVALVTWRLSSWA